jgi:hypothetical protein
MWLQVLLAHFGVIGRRYEPALQGLIAQDKEEDYILDHVECAFENEILWVLAEDTLHLINV